MRGLICPHLCRYYKPEKTDEEGCGGVLWLERRPELAPAVSRLAVDMESHLFGQAADHPLLLAVCRQCPYLIDGCDFRDPDVPDEQCSPCGGLRAVAGLLASGLDLGSQA